MLIRRSRNSYMRSRRSVTLQPIGQPSRILKPAIDLRALVTTGFWPAISVHVGDRVLDDLLVAIASPTPMFRVILSMRGTCITLLVAELLHQLRDDRRRVVFLQSGHVPITVRRRRLRRWT